MSRLKLVRRQAIERLMNPLGVVKRFDVTKHAQSRILNIGERFKLRLFVLQRQEKLLHHRVVVTATGSAHRTADPQSARSRLIVFARVLIAAIAVVRQFACFRAARFDRLPQGTADYGSRKALADVPADDLSAEQIENDGEINATCGGRQVSDISAPLWARGRHSELLREQVGRGLLGGIGLTRGRLDLRRNTDLESNFTHRLGNRIAARRFQIRVDFEGAGNLGASVYLIGRLENSWESIVDAGGPLNAPSRLGFARTIEFARAHRQNSAHHGDRVGVSVFLDPGVFHCNSFAKYALG